MTPTPAENATIHRTHAPGIRSVALSRAGREEIFLTAEPLPGERPAATLARAGRLVAECNARIVALDVFGIPAADADLRAAFGDVSFPITRVLNRSPESRAPGGVQVHALTGLAVEPIFLHGRVVGAHWRDDQADYCRIGGLLPAAGSPVEEARQHLALLESILAGVGLEFTDVARTWFYFDSILSWYTEFRQTRQAFFARRGLLGGPIPASTGMGGPNPSGTALTSGLFAFRPRAPGRVEKRELPSPLQCPAPAYGSFFSRAMEISFPDHRRVLVSGTASIDQEGRPVFAGDPFAQIDFTFRVVEAILSSRGMSFADATRAVAYFKHDTDLEVMTDVTKRMGLPDIPMVRAHNDVCFDELLFELEVDAIRAD